MIRRRGAVALPAVPAGPQLGVARPRFSRIGATVVLLLAAALQPAHASCSPLAVPFGTFVDSTTRSFIYRSGWGPSYGGSTYAGYSYDSFPAVDRASLFGVFWAIGSGDPSTTAGDDSGTFPVNDWIRSRDYPSTFYYAAEIFEYNLSIGWGTDARINGCLVNSATANGCMCVLLADNGLGPQFTVFSKQMDDAFMVDFVLPGNAPIKLAPIPMPSIVASVRDPTTFDMTLDVHVPAPPAGIYEQDGCDCNVQYLVREFVRPKGQVPEPGTEEASEFGNLTNHSATDFGTNAVGIRSLCGSQDNDVWLATQIVVDSDAAQGGWTTPWVSLSSFCGPFCCGPSCPGDGAEEVCFDGRDNDCDGFADEPSPELVADGFDQDCDGVDSCYQDTDGDSYGSVTVITGDDLDCNNTPGEADDNTDCDDTNSAINPATLWYADTDVDGFGDPNVSEISCTQPSGKILDNTDCDDGNSDTYPGAFEVVDGMDNQCPGEYGFGTIDETSGNSGFLNPADRNEYSWPPVAGATLYEYVRSTRKDFAADCLSAFTAAVMWVDGVDPPQGGVFYYLNRPDPGSWGPDSAGVERPVVCAP